MKVLITGGTGFVGSHLTETLLEKGFEVSLLHRKTSDLSFVKDLNQCGGYKKPYRKCKKRRPP